MLMLLAALATPTFAQATPTPAEIRQDVLPALTGRAARADARVRAAQAWFDGTSTFEDAWPALAPVDVLDQGLLRASRRRLAREAEARAAERIRPLPADATLARALTQARTTALDAEDRFAQLEERLLAGLQSGLARAPLLDATVLRPVLDELDATIAAGGPEATEEVNQAADQALADKSRIQSARRAAIAAFTVPGSTALATWYDETPQSPVTTAHLALVRALLPLLDGDRQAAAQAQIDAAREQVEAEAEAERAAAIAAAEATLASPPPLDEDETLEVLQAAVAEAREALSAAAPEDEPLAQLRLQLAEKRLAIRAGEVAEDASAAQKRAEEAREAEEATRKEGEREDKTLSALRSRVLAVQGAVAEVYEEEAARREATEERIRTMRSRLDERIEAGANALALSLLDPNRQSSIDRAYLDLRASVRTLYEELDDLRDLEHTLADDDPLRLALLEGWTATRGSAELIKLDDAFQTARANLDEALANRARTLGATRDEVYRMLDVARDNRRVMRQVASSAARSQARRDFFPELRREVTALPGQLSAGIRGLGLSLLAIPTFLGNLDALWALVIGSFELVVLIGLWGVARRQMRAMASRALDLVQERLGAPLEGERELSVSQLTALGIALVDLITALVAFSRLGEGMGAIGLLLLIWAVQAALVGAPLLARCALATPQQMHPSLRLVTPPTEDLAARTLWWLAAWAGLSRIGTYTMIALLDADRLRDVVGMLSSVAFWLLVVAFVIAWGPVAVDTLARQAEHSTLTAWAARAPRRGPARVLDLPRYVVALGIVSTQLTVHLFTRLVEGSAGLGWLQSALARRQLKVEEGEPVALAPPPEVVLQRLDVARSDGMARSELEERLRTAHAGWKETGRRGLVSLIGDAGSGKAQLLRRLPEVLDTPVVALEVERRLSEPAEVIQFLAAGLGVEATDADGLIAALQAREPATIAVDRAHLLFLRCVRGYKPLQTLVSVMTATAERHFWVLAVHEPAWAYLMGIAAQLQLDAFRDHIRLLPADGAMLAGWLEERSITPENPISYEPLATTGLLGGDEGLAERRARSAYWRLLSDASGGIPENAVELWRRSLSLGPEGTIDVHMFTAPSADDIQDLSDAMLFALKALVQHERLTSDELARVLNKRPGAARAAARSLVHLGLAEHHPADLTYTLPPLWAPAVQRLLRQKHFLYVE